MQVKSAGITDVGLKRKGNEDHFSAEDSLCLYIVADGMGGHQAGEVASRMAVEMIYKSYEKWVTAAASADELFGSPDDSLSTRGNYVQSSIRLANRIVYETARDVEQYHGMGTTVGVLAIHQDRIVAANVGDSRIYMVREGHLERLSKDHTLVSEQVALGMMTPEEAESSPLRHVLTKNLGSYETVDPEIYEIEPSNNDRFILCSDGLTDLVSDEEILQMTLNADEPVPLCQKFIETALKRGGHDNTTVVSAFLTDMISKKGGPISRMGLFLAYF
ncbi:MAG: Stp1/IreP family PP2C-type Ser/Thr phosphatase [Pseudomonadota bacterium]